MAGRLSSFLTKLGAGLVIAGGTINQALYNGKKTCQRLKTLNNEQYFVHLYHILMMGP